MPTKRIPMEFGHAVLTEQSGWRPGDPAPPNSAYLDWHAWAEVQHKAGLRQQQCASCGKWKFPQELSEGHKEWTAYTRRGQPMRVIAPLCKACNPPGAPWPFPVRGDA